MIINHNWLKEWIAVDYELLHLTELLTTAGLEVSSISRVPEFSKNPLPVDTWIETNYETIYETNFPDFG